MLTYLENRVNMLKIIKNHQSIKFISSYCTNSLRLGCNCIIQSNEWICSPLLMKFLADYCYCYKNNLNIYGYNARNLYANSTIYIMPMVNPDGVNLVTGEIDSNSSLYTNTKLIADNYPQIPFPDGWKANIRGVDLKNFQPFCKVL